MLAAANSVYGRWDDTKGEDNIDFMPTILSRFDMIFIIKDQHDQQRDMVRTNMFNPATLNTLRFSSGSVFIRSLTSNLLSSCLQTLARHVMNVHLSAQTQTEGVEGEIPLSTYKKYIAYARA